jgi:hypothetical protein
MVLAKLVILGLVTSSHSAARPPIDCPCSGYTSQEWSVSKQVNVERKYAKALFSGKVISVVEQKSERGHTLEVRFKVIDSWKYVRTGAVTVITHFPVPGSCGYPFKVGQSYLVYVEREDDGNLWTTVCSRTTLLDMASADLKVLGRGKIKIGDQ